MTAPKIFSVAEAGTEPHRLQGLDHVFAYRFGDQTVARDWLSRLRQAQGGNFQRPADNVLNDWALKQTSYGSQSENIDGNPFISIATDFESLYANGEGWVQKILQSVPTLATFVIPFDKVFRPRPTKSISKLETEWLYYDGDVPITQYLVQWQPNPKRV